MRLILLEPVLQELEAAFSATRAEASSHETRRGAPAGLADAVSRRHDGSRGEDITERVVLDAIEARPTPYDYASAP